MLDKIYNINAYLYEGLESENIVFYQNDTEQSGIEVNFFSEYNVPFDISATTVTCLVAKSDGTQVTEYMTIDESTNNKASVIFHSNTLAAPGKNTLYIIVYGTNGEKQTFGSLKFQVRKDVENGSVVSTTEYPVLTSLITDVNGLKTSLETDFQAINDELEGNVVAANLSNSQLQAALLNSQSAIDKIESSEAYNRTILTSEWIYNSSLGKYEFNIGDHNLASRNLIVTITTSDGSSVVEDFKIIDMNNIVIYNEDTTELSVTLVARYYKNTGGQDIANEVVEARGTNVDLATRFNGIDSSLAEKATQTTTTNLQNQVNAIVLNGTSGDSSAEVTQARVDYSGNTFSTMKSRNDNIEKLLFEKISTFNNITFEQGGTGTSGDYTANNRIRSLGFININGAITFSIDSSWKYNIIEYDSSGVFIKAYGFTSNSTTVDGTKGNKFRLSVGKNDDTTITPSLFSGKLNVSYAPNIGIFADLKKVDTMSNILTNKELVYSKQENGYYQISSFVASGTNTVYYYDVSGLKSVFLTTTQTQYKNLYTLLDKDLNVLNSLRVNDPSMSATDLEIVLNNAYYIAISETKATPIANKKITYLTTITKSVVSTSQQNKWFGKKIVWFGTSIPAGGKSGLEQPNSYPRLLGGKLGATVINEAIGESSLHCKATHRVDVVNNPYGFEENWNKCARCLTNTLVEVEWLLTNWNNTTIFTTGTLTSITDDDRNFYRSCSYENKLLPHLTANDVNLFVLDHGHNDRYDVNKINNVTVTDEEVMTQFGEFNLYTFEGASNFIINKILSANQRNKICFIGEYENQKLPLIAPHQLKVSGKWLFPIYKQWEKLGWSQNKITTTGYWDNATGLWVESGGISQEITMLNRWIKDNIHPHSDLSGKATDWLISNMLQWFLYTL